MAFVHLRLLRLTSGSYLVLVDPFQKSEIGEKEGKEEEKKREKKRKRREGRGERRREVTAN